MNVQEARLGDLVCRIVDDLPAETAPQLVVVLCHGFGAPGTDLVALGPELMASSPDIRERVRFVFPEGMLSLDESGMFGCRAWWQLDVERLVAAVERGEFRNLRDDVPDGLPAAREKLTSLVDTVLKQTGLPVSRVVLGGFSQGAMLATDVSLRLAEPPAALCIFSGSLMCEQQWQPLAAQRGPLPVLQSHGRQDPILPYLAAEWLRDMLVSAGMQVDFLPFDGMHTIALEALQRFGATLEQLVAGNPSGPVTL